MAPGFGLLCCWTCMNNPCSAGHLVDLLTTPPPLPPHLLCIYLNVVRILCCRSPGLWWHRDGHQQPFYTNTQSRYVSLYESNGVVIGNELLKTLRTTHVEEHSYLYKTICWLLLSVFKQRCQFVLSVSKDGLLSYSDSPILQPYTNKEPCMRGPWDHRQRCCWKNLHFLGFSCALGFVYNEADFSLQLCTKQATKSMCSEFLAKEKIRVRIG